MSDDREDDRDVGAGVGYYDDPIDEVLIEYLGDELLGIMLEPPRVPTFAAETLPPKRVCS